MTHERWEAMSEKERKAWRERRETINASLAAVVTTIVMRILLHWLGWTP